MKTNRQPNLLFIMSDQQKATSLDLYNRGGNSIETTSLRRIGDSGVTFNCIDESEPSDLILSHYQYLAQHLCRISTNGPEVTIAQQDEWYRAGGDKTWSESLPEEVQQ
jgi:hypothetical protein